MTVYAQAAEEYELPKRKRRYWAGVVLGVPFGSDLRQAVSFVRASVRAMEGLQLCCWPSLCHTPMASDAIN